MTMIIPPLLAVIIVLIIAGFFAAVATALRLARRMFRQSQSQTDYDTFIEALEAKHRDQFRGVRHPNGRENSTEQS